MNWVDVTDWQPPDSENVLVAYLPLIDNEDDIFLRICYFGTGYFNEEEEKWFIYHPNNNCNVDKNFEFKEVIAIAWTILPAINLGYYENFREQEKKYMTPKKGEKQ